MNPVHDYYSRERAEMLPYIPAGTRRILDVGCGDGAFGAALHRRRPEVEVHGIEMDPEAAARARETYHHVSLGLFPADLPPAAGQYDCVIFNDVLEHIEDPWSALEALHPHLAPGATVLASIPNVRYFPVLYKLVVRGQWTYTPAGVLDQTHLRFFTSQSIHTLFATTGYDVDLVRGINPLRRWPLRLLRVVLPGFADDVRHVQFAVVARSLRSG